MKKVEQIEDKTVTLRYDRQEAVQRSHLPQGPLRALAVDLSGPPFFAEIDLNNAFFRTLDITVDNLTDFDKIGLLKADVELEYGDLNNPDEVRRKDLSFTKDGDKQASHKFFLNQDLDLEYRARTQYHFDPGSGWEGRAMTYELPATETLDRTLLVNPWSELGFLEIKLVSGEMDQVMMRHTEVTLNYEGGGWSTSKVFIVKPGDAEQHWKLRLDDPAARTFSYSMVHHLADGTTRDGESGETELTTVYVNDPFENPISVEIMPNFDPSAVKQVFLQITYSDPANNYERNETMTFNADNMASQKLRLARFDNGPMDVSYRATSMGTNNSVNRHATVTMAEPFVFLSELMV